MRSKRWVREAALVAACLSTVSVGIVGDAVGALEDRLISVYESIAPAVVHITVRGTTEDVFMRPVPTAGSGSGFLFDTLGHIVTNYHVIADADAITVAFDGIQCCPAVLVGIDPSTDLAVIRVDRPSLPTPLPLGDSDALRVGQFVLAVGNPFGLQQTATFGIISALGRVIQSPDGRFIGEAIQTDASINPGNSGGPLLDLEGHVIGVTSQIISPVEASAGIGFAVSSNTVARVVPQLISQGRFPHPYLGIVGFDLSPERVQLFREVGVELPLDSGILVLAVDENGPADLGGLRGADRTIPLGSLEFPAGGDVILEVNGIAFGTMVELLLYIDSEVVIGERVDLLVLRNGVTLLLQVVIGERPDDTESA